ncbi:MAG: hypothetical protein HY741_06850 [Chloroflexi bacterium]|nr:hypothetical protein [Chloroflexota bacterium]
MKSNIIALVLASAFILLAACDGQATTPPPPSPPPLTATPPTAATVSSNLPAAPASGICKQGVAPAFLKRLVLTTNTQGANYTPVDEVESYASDQATFHAVVALENAPPDAKLRAAWYLVNAAGYTPNSKITETALSINTIGTRNIDFTLKPDANSWPPGTYCVQVYVNETLAVSKTFTVTRVSTPSNATLAVLKQVVLAQDTNPNTFEPVNATTTFAKSAPFIHVAIQIDQAPANTVFRARWFPPNQDPLENELVSDGTRWLDFRLTPAPDGFPTGAYKVEIYVNDQLADTKSFTVQ